MFKQNVCKEASKQNSKNLKKGTSSKKKIKHLCGLPVRKIHRIFAHAPMLIKPLPIRFDHTTNFLNCLLVSSNLYYIFRVFLQLLLLMNCEVYGTSFFQVSCLWIFFLAYNFFWMNWKFFTKYIEDHVLPLKRFSFFVCFFFTFICHFIGNHLDP